MLGALPFLVVLFICYFFYFMDVKMSFTTRRGLACGVADLAFFMKRLILRSPVYFYISTRPTLAGRFISNLFQDLANAILVTLNCHFVLKSDNISGVFSLCREAPCPSLVMAAYVSNKIKM